MSRHWDFRKEFSPARRPRRRFRRRGFWRFDGGEIKLVLVVGITLGLASQLGSFGIGSGGSPLPAATRTAAVATISGPVRIIDGDTFDHQGERIRIADIDTPELSSACAAEVRLAQAAKSRLGILLAEGPFELHRI